jgi:site-specific recombinase XerD
VLLLDSLDINRRFGHRNRALFELLYSSGLRIGEALRLNLEDIELKERVLTVRGGKGGKDRVVPFSEAAAAFLRLYIEGERKYFTKFVKREENPLYLTAKGRMSRDSAELYFQRALKQLGLLEPKRTLHSIRHSTATHLLESGADINQVAELLGHESLETTVSYTHLGMESIRRAYKTAHPRENNLYEEITDEYLAAVEELKKKFD